VERATFNSAHSSLTVSFSFGLVSGGLRSIGVGRAMMDVLLSGLLLAGVRGPGAGLGGLVPGPFCCGVMGLAVGWEQGAIVLGVDAVPCA
jgi:hypothetical protein